MKVKELIERLEGCNQESIVIMSSDEEYNRFNSCNNVSSCYYHAEDTWSGDIRDLNEMNGLKKDDGLTKEEFQKKLKENNIIRVVCLWPVS